MLETNKKYKLTNETKETHTGITLYRIKALRNFGDVKKGDLGGFIEREFNLSQKGTCWVYDSAEVYGSAVVCRNAVVAGNAIVYEYAEISGNAIVYDNARVSGCAKICDDAKVYGCARISRNAKVFGNAEVYRDAVVSGHAKVYRSAKVSGGAKVSGDAKVSGNARISDNAIVCGFAKASDDAIVSGTSKLSEQQRVTSGVVTVDLKNNIKESIRCQTGLLPHDGEVIAYKQVDENMCSFYDDNFKYEVGEVAEVKYPDMSNDSCASGLHFSNANYWNKSQDVNNSIFLEAKIKLEDIITVQRGKIRCKKAKIIGKYTI